MHIFDLLAEQRIADAVARGELDDLPGAGRPLDLDDDPMVPEDLRLAYRILKNAGLVPPELELRRQIRDVESLIGSLERETPAAAAALRKLELLRMKLDESSGLRGAGTCRSYEGKLLSALGRTR